MNHTRYGRTYLSASTRDLRAFALTSTLVAGVSLVVSLGNALPARQGGEGCPDYFEAYDITSDDCEHPDSIPNWRFWVGVELDFFFDGIIFPTEYSEAAEMCGYYYDIATAFIDEVQVLATNLTVRDTARAGYTIHPTPNLPNGAFG
jgi:hypothetical protein